MAEVAVAFLLEQVKEVVVGYKDLIAGAKNEFRQLNDELGQLKRHLKDVSRDDAEGIRELVYEVEDTIDTCLTQAALARERNGFSRCVQPNRISLAQQVKILRQQKVKPILDRLAGMQPGGKAIANGSDTTMEEQQIEVKKDVLFRQDNVVDLEDVEKTIIGYLMEPMKKLDIVSIIGMPGLGKTTLAWKIYLNKKVADEFPILIWIHVSQRFKPRDVFISILEQSISKDAPRLSHTELSNQKLTDAIRACLEKEKFLLVMDDVWSVDDWKTIKSVLPYNNGKGKVLVTSRHENVGTLASVNRKPHFLRSLKLDESWKLLQLEVFENLESCPLKLATIGKDIAEKCKGVPLTILVIGGIIAEQLTKTQSVIALEKEWIKVSEKVNLFLEEDKEKHIYDVVELSYQRLPDDLKECFLYLGVYPENHEIPVWTLTRLWIAEGFIQPKKGRTLEESAEENLYDLINRNLLMVGKKNLDQVKTCRVHDMIRAFCRSVALEKNLFRVMRRSNDGLLEPPVSEVKNYHRLCLHSDLNKFLSVKPHGPLLRSFLYFHRKVNQVEDTHRQAIPDAFKLLRVLHSRYIRFQVYFPENLTKLTHLRYIALCIHDLKFIPEQISQLWNLQTILVDTNSTCVIMKANIWKMIRLRHIKTKAAIVLDKNWKGSAGENLQTLNRLSAESWTTAVSERASNLKTLGFRGKLATLIDATSLENLHFLERLKLVNDLPYESASDKPLQHLPRGFPPNLKRLTLSNTYLAWKHMSTLTTMESLEVIKLKDNAFTGYSWTVGDGGFRNLQLLLIVNSDLVCWEVSTDQFPRLRCLVLKDCKNLRTIPGSLARNLERLEIDHVRRAALDSARIIEVEKKEAEELQGTRLGVPFKLTVGLVYEQ